MQRTPNTTVPTPVSTPNSTIGGTTSSNNNPLNNTTTTLTTNNPQPIIRGGGVGGMNQPTSIQQLPPILGKEQQLQTDSKYEILDKEINRLASLMEQLIDSSKVMDGISNNGIMKLINKTQNEKDSLQLSVVSSSMIDAGQNLLRLISDLKNQYLFFDYERIKSYQSSVIVNNNNINGNNNNGENGDVNNNNE
ncbi:hypothetical protein ABK040_002500 [Willaertia magna]